MTDAHKKRTVELITKALNCDTDVDFAILLHHVFGKHWKLADVKNDNWYHFDGKRWVVAEAGSDFKLECQQFLYKISEGAIGSKLQTIQDELSIKKTTDFKKLGEDDRKNIKNEIKELEQNEKKLKSVERRIKNSSGLAGIHTECKKMFNDSHFLEKLDENHKLIGFNNGVYDLNKMEFRNSTPDDYISFTTGYDFVPIDDDNDEYQKMISVLKDIYSSPYCENPDNIYDKYEYVSSFTASMLDGHQYDHDMAIFSGEGSGGKSVFMELLIKALGDYSLKINNSIITDQKTNGYELAETKGRRVLISSESAKNASLNEGLIKEFTGDTSFSARQIYSRAIRFCPQAKILLFTNYDPKISDDSGMRRRLRVIRHTNTYVEDPCKDRPHEKLKDNSLLFQVGKWGNLFMNHLIKYYLKLKNNKYKIAIPTVVADEKEQFIDTSSSSNNDAEEYDWIYQVVELGTSDDFVVLKDVKEKFKELAKIDPTATKSKKCKLLNIKKILGNFDKKRTFALLERKTVNKKTYNSVFMGLKMKDIQKNDVDEPTPEKC